MCMYLPSGVDKGNKFFGQILFINDIILPVVSISLSLFCLSFAGYYDWIKGEWILKTDAFPSI